MKLSVNILRLLVCRRGGLPVVRTAVSRVMVYGDDMVLWLLIR